MKTQFAIVAAAVLSGLFISAQAQQNDLQNIETIRIIGTHSPLAVGQIAGSVTIIDEARISASGAIGVSDLLRTVAGVNIGQTGTTGSLQEVRFRGSESNHVMVLVDGVAINDVGQGGITDFSHLLLANISRIEILRGPQSAIWGSNAIAGIISITTKQAESRELTASAQLGVGNNSTQSANIHIAQQLNDLSYKINASTYKTKGENISRIGNEDDGYRNNDLSSALNYRLNQNNRIDVNARFMEYTNDADSYDFTTGLVGDGNAIAEGKHISAGLNWYFAPHRNPQEDRIYSQLVSLQYSKQETNNFSNNAFDRTSSGEKLRMLWSNRFEFTTSKWLNIGLESTNEEFTQRGPNAASGVNQQQSNDTWSIVSDGLYALNNELSLSASYRYDNNDIFDNAGSYRIGVTYTISNDWRIFASQGRAIKNPTFVERFGFFPNTFTGNPDLIPEQQTSIEMGIEGAFDNVTVQVNWFNATLNDEILGFVFVPETGGFTAQNSAQESTREGIELSLNGQVNNVSWQAQYSYLDAAQENAAELRRSKHTGSISATYTYSAQHQYYVQADYTGTKLDQFFPPAQAAQLVSLKSYWLVSANYQYTYSQNISLNVRLSNSFNEQYEDVFGYNTNGREALLGLRYTF